MMMFCQHSEKYSKNTSDELFRKHSVLTENQFGFRSNRDTCLAVADMIDKVTEKLDAYNYSLGLFIDLSKAFDTLDYAILIAKLEFYGVRDNALNWFRSYLSNRQQCVDYNGVQSSLLHIRTAVRQGSTFGPLLFLIHINDIVNVSKFLHLILFAHDTNIFLHHSDLNI